MEGLDETWLTGKSRYAYIILELKIVNCKGSKKDQTESDS